MDPLELRRIGTTDIKVTALGMGSAPMGSFSGPDGAADAAATTRRAYDLGIRLFDYGSAVRAGTGRKVLRLGARRV